MFVKVSSLPTSLQSFLKNTLEYTKGDISLEGAETTSPLGMGGSGRKDYFAVFNLATMTGDVTWGSWGGANAYNPSNVVDSVDKHFTLPPNAIVIKGHIGGMGSNHASMRANPATLAPLLPPSVEITDNQVGILVAFRGLKSGPYRQEALARYTAEEIAQCVAKGWLKESKNGAKQITTEGKNAIVGKRGPSGLAY